MVNQAMTEIFELLEVWVDCSWVIVGCEALAATAHT